MIVHLAQRRGIVCETTGNVTSSGELSAVTCRKCPKRLAVVAVEESDAAFERRDIAAGAVAAEYLGVSHLWARVAIADNPTDRLVRGVLGAVLRRLAEEDAA